MPPLPLTPDRLCVHQVTLMQCDFRASIECLSRHGVTKTAVWRDKLDEIGIADATRILADNGVDAISLCPGGMLTAPEPAAMARALDDNRRWIEQAAALGAKSMVVITGGLAEGDRDLASARARFVDGLAQLLPDARAAGLKLALEPLHPMVCGNRSVISTLEEAGDMLDRLDADDVTGLAVDVYGLWWDGALKRRIESAGSRILNFHVADWLAETRDLRFDRGMPGDGLIDIPLIRGWMEAAGFTGPVEVEIFSKTGWWRRDPDDVMRTIVGRMGGSF